MKLTREDDYFIVWQKGFTAGVQHQKPSPETDERLKRLTGIVGIIGAAFITNALAMVGIAVYILLNI